MFQRLPAPYARTISTVKNKDYCSQVNECRQTKGLFKHACTNESICCLKIDMNSKYNVVYSLGIPLSANNCMNNASSSTIMQKTILLTLFNEIEIILLNYAHSTTKFLVLLHIFFPSCSLTSYFFKHFHHHLFIENLYKSC